MNHEIFTDILVPLISAALASTGLWGILKKHSQERSATTRLLLGLAYDKITGLGLSYIERGWISKDEYEDYRKYLYEPYMAFGGNGVVERIMEEVSKLPIRASYNYKEIQEAKRQRSLNGEKNEQ